jgi:biopolymer transport protein ExbD
VFEEWRQAKEEDHDLNLIPVMNLFMVLIPFLLMGAAFFHMAVIPTSTPSHTPGESDVPKTPTTVSASLVIKSDRLALNFSSTNLTKEQMRDLGAEWPVTDGEMPVEKMQSHLLSIKQKYPDSTTLVVLPDGELPYQQLVEVLDKTREIQDGTDKDGDKIYKELFPVTVFSKLIKSKPGEPDQEDGPAAPAEQGGEE